MSKLFGTREVNEQARAWVIELDDEPPSAERLAELRAWLGRSPLHRRAFERAVSTWRSMDCLTRILKHEAVATHDGVAWESGAHEAQVPAQKVGRVRTAILAAVTAVVLIGIVASAAFLWHPRTAAVTSSTYATATGEVTAITLSDGSTIHLNTASRVTVTYARNARILQLVAGEAYFEVAPSPQRPFVVYAGRFSVRALGTAFAVQMLDSGVDLTVTQGQVELASFKTPPRDVAGAAASGLGLPEGEAGETRYSVSLGQHIVVSANGRRVEKIDAEGIEKRLAWRDGVLIFDDDPLKDVVAEITRYTATRIVIADPSIRDVKIGGYFKVQDINSILGTLQENFGIDVRKDNDNVVYLARGRPAH
ncbi:MAG TPA: FecR domain-containing protein [Steroidobacteraceae bacterium]|nr:FecR domain-containing protein [Steroidobacteraceae bacterium]